MADSNLVIGRYGRLAEFDSLICHHATSQYNRGCGDPTPL